MDLGTHAAFIWLSYGVVAALLAALIAWLAFDGRRQQRLLADLEARGITRRSQTGRGAGATGEPAGAPDGPVT